MIEEDNEEDLTLLNAGPELNIAVQAAAKFRDAGHVEVRVASLSCKRLFDKHSDAYKNIVLGKGRPGRVSVAAEAYAASGWERYANAAVCMSTERFGQSLPGLVAYSIPDLRSTRSLRR